MKEISDLNFPSDRKYSKDHEWTVPNDDIYCIGISDYAQDQLGEIVYVELPEEGDLFSKGDGFGSVESVKTVSELYIPLSCEVVEINSELESQPELVNTSPYKDGWMVKVKASNPSEFEEMLSRDQYLEMIDEP